VEVDGWLDVEDVDGGNDVVEGGGLGS